MFEQLDFWAEVQQPGDWVSYHGRELTFDEITQRVGQLIVWDMSTQSHEWFKVVRVEKIVFCDGHRRVVFYDGGKQRGYCSEIYFNPTTTHPARAYLLTP